MVANIIHQLVLVTTAIVAGYAAIVLFLSFPAPQRWAVYLHWINFPFFTDFDTPEYFGFGHNKVRNIHISAEDGTSIGAWHFLPSHYYMGQQLRYRSKDRMQDAIYDLALGNPDYETVIYFHGNAGNRAAPWRVDLYKKIGDKFPNVNVIAIDYRGFGNSDGTPSEEGLRMDARATWDWLRQRGVPNDKISIIGHSLGTGIATSLAYELSRNGNPPKALILKAAYSSLPTLLFEYRALKYIPFFAPIKLFPPVQKWLKSRMVHQFDSLSRIQYVDCPILIIYGAVDFEIPGHNSQKLFHRAIYGLEAEVLYSDEWLANDPNIKNVTIPNEVSVYQHHRNPDVKLAVLTYAHHNNVGYFDYVFEAMGRTAKWVLPGEVPLVEV
ncbi:hypothetical protein K450DRAFT_229121 [Umbelopsis ramanniana AG]|uniref:AB hydrolase-1 domain-containing protein n=1 Tax=Umbelopsis ramanniana AG TaxID=1314678 RepID=A0AAD5HHE9_UMBRA|nr:uncharacterized protein K450DRAFT_229121 [Umbelopsis ramanniana AG]KAI8582123.1 hypothetical protein K450DRAFT_229121 [Umbelopsis ramanniana AG]